MSRLLDQLNEEQLDFVLSYRKTVQQATADLIQNLADSKFENASLLALAESAGVVGDVVYVTSLFGNNKLNLSLNYCETVDDFRQKLYLFAINEMIRIVNQYIKLNEGTKTKYSEEDLKAAQNAIKH